VATALDALGDVWFTDIVTPWTDATSIAAVEARLATNFGPLVMRDTHAWAAVAGAFGDLTTYGAARNSPHLTVLGMRGSPTPPWEWAATLAAVAVPALAIDPARPVQTLPVPWVIAPSIAQRWTWTERDQLLRAGIATTRHNDAGQSFVERAVTTYQTSPGGAADVSYLDVETLKTLAYLRYDLRQLIALRFPRHKLADDGTAFARGQAVVTPGTLRAEIIARFKQWEAAGLVEGVDQFKADLIVVRNTSDPNRVDALLPPDLVNQFRALAAQIEFLL
jgi:phage tail sheath gpL-like